MYVYSGGDLVLDDAANARLEEASALELEYPADILAMFRRMARSGTR